MRTARREVAAGWHFLLTETPTPRVLFLKTHVWTIKHFYVILCLHTTQVGFGKFSTLTLGD